MRTQIQKIGESKKKTTCGARKPEPTLNRTATRHLYQGWKTVLITPS